MVAREGLAVVARQEDARLRQEDARRHLVIPTGIPTADRRGDMTIADRRGSARAVIALTGIDHPAAVHRMSGLRTTVFLAIAAPLIGPSATAHRVTALQLLATQQTAHPVIVHSVIVHRVIGFRRIAFPVTVRPAIVPRGSDPPVMVHQATVPMDDGMALHRVPMDAAMIAVMTAAMTVLRAFQDALMTMASVPMSAVMTRARVLQLQIGSVRIARLKDASEIALNAHQIDTVPVMSVASRPQGPALATRVPAPSVPICSPRLKPRRRPQMI
ncbi:MAG: hypothetical protein ACJ0GX_07170 [Parasynechococcus sp.]|uniref:hypothetical protein n=1 Tax=Parasynechococcus sp. TaxID=3101203 RepID=UPI0038876D8E|tara:strand:- start:825 stop:1640 length:816 start_codon:yes stop_codon:yes gene_type:complete